MSCEGKNINGYGGPLVDSAEYLNFIGATGQDLTLTNSFDISGVTMAYFNTLIGSTGSTVQATNGIFTNLTGTVNGVSEILLKKIETNNDNSTLIISDALAGPTGQTNTRGFHAGYNTVNQNASLYCLNNTNTITPIIMQDTLSFGRSYVGTPSIHTNEILEYDNGSGVQIQNGIKFLNNGKTIRNSVDDIIIDANNATNKTIRLQSASTDILNISDLSIIGSTRVVVNNNSADSFTINNNNPPFARLFSAGDNVVNATDQRFVVLKGPSALQMGVNDSQYTFWKDLNITGSTLARTIFGSPVYFGPPGVSNVVVTNGHIDVAPGFLYKINNSPILSGGTNTIIYNQSGQLCLIDSSGAFKIDNSAAGLYIGNDLVRDAANSYFKNGSATATLTNAGSTGCTYNFPNKSGTQTLACLSDITGSLYRSISYSFYPKAFTSPSQTAIAQYFIFPGTSVLPITKIYLCFGQDTSSGTDILVYDYNSNLTIANYTSVLTPSPNPVILDLGPLTNMSSSQTIWDIKIQTSGGSQSSLYYILLQV